VIGTLGEEKTKVNTLLFQFPEIVRGQSMLSRDVSAPVRFPWAGGDRERPVE
jgi:hypothetical protein